MTSEIKTPLLDTIIADLQQPAKIDEIHRALITKHRIKVNDLLNGLYFLLASDNLLPKDRHIAIIVYLRLCEENKDSQRRRALWEIEKYKEDDNVKMLIYEMVVLKSFEKVNLKA